MRTSFGLRAVWPTSWRSAASGGRVRSKESKPSPTQRRQIIVQVRGLATMEGMTGAPRPALAVVADPTDVTPASNEKNVGTTIGLSRSAFQASAARCELLKIHVLRNRGDEVDVFRIDTWSTNRTDQTQLKHAVDLDCGSRELKPRR